MQSDLDRAYQALKRAETSASVSSDAEVDALRDEAVDAMAKYMAACVWRRTWTEGDASKDVKAQYAAFYAEASPKALVIITTVVGVMGDLAQGNSDPDLDRFLEGLTFGKGS